MSTAIAPAPLPTVVGAATKNSEAGHKVRLIAGYIVAIALIAGIMAYGFDYYTASANDRPFMAKHVLLRPSGRIGVKLGIVGFAMFLAIFLYPLRKYWTCLLYTSPSPRDMRRSRMPSSA